jgi:hypothetical protein
MFTDDSRRVVQDEINRHGLRAFNRLLTDEVLVEAAEKSGTRIGDSPLHLGRLAWLGVACAFHATRTFAEVLTLTLTILKDSETFAGLPSGHQTRRKPQPRSKKQSSRKGRRAAGQRRKKAPRSKHNPHGMQLTEVTEEAFVQARQRMPWEYWIALIVIVADRFARQHADCLCWKQFRLLALDGTTINLPQDRRLADHFGTARNGTKKKVRRIPQARLAMLQFPLTRVPFRFALGPLATGERTMASPLLNHLAANDLLLMDRGFWSFGMFWDIQRRGAFFGIRLVASVKLKTLRRLAPKDRIVRYAPRKSRRSWKKEGYPASIELRVIDYQIPGFRKSAIVTNVLDPNVISSEDWVRLATDSEAGRNLAPGLYHRRWEIETTFRELKVEQGMERRLRGRTPAAVRYEIAGHVLLYLLTRWLMLKAALAHGTDPLRLSFTKACRQLEDMQVQLVSSSSHHVQHVLLPRLLKRIASHLVPVRPNRHYPRPNDTRRKNKGHGLWQLPSKLKALPRKNVGKRAA